MQRLVPFVLIIVLASCMLYPPEYVWLFSEACAAKQRRPGCGKSEFSTKPFTHNSASTLFLVSKSF